MEQCLIEGYRDKQTFSRSECQHNRYLKYIYIYIKEKVGLLQNSFVLKNEGIVFLNSIIYCCMRKQSCQSKVRVFFLKKRFCVFLPIAGVLIKSFDVLKMPIPFCR